MRREIRGAVAMVTGGSRGLGPVIAGHLARRGARLAIVARSAAELAAVGQRLRASGAEVVEVVGDITDPTGRERAVATAESGLGPIDILVNNAGVENEGAFADLAPEKIRATFEVNVLGPMALTRLIVPGMVARRSGHIVNMASAAALSGTPYEAVYSASKAALVEWTRALRLELAGSGVGCSVVMPGFVTQTGMFARFGMRPPWSVGSCTPDQVAEAVVSGIERGRLEIIVNSRPLRPLVALAAAFPGLRDPVMRRLGIVAFQKRKVSRPPDH